MFEVVHSDVWGPLTLLNHDHFEYDVLFIDDYNCMTRMYFIQERTKVFSKFMFFVNDTNTQYSTTLKTFQSVNALEYTLQFSDNTLILMALSMRPRVSELYNRMELLNASTDISLKSEKV